MFEGAYTALVTPFRDGQVDYARLRENVDWQVDHGIDGVVPVGTTGESPTLSHEEHRKVIETVVDQAGGRVKVVAGAGSNSTNEALALTAHAKSVGADGVLLVNPYYNKPTQEGLYRHFTTIADAVEIPQVLYNIPGRTGVTVLPQTTARLAEHANIVGVKEASGSLDIASEVLTLTNRDQFFVISGDDSLTLPLMAVGAVGVISVLTNLAVEPVKVMVDAAAKGDLAMARRGHLELFALCKGLLTLAVNPIPIKTALMLVGRDTGEMRLPLCELDGESRAKLEKLLAARGLVGGKTARA